MRPLHWSSTAITSARTAGARTPSSRRSSNRWDRDYGSCTATSRCARVTPTLSRRRRRPKREVAVHERSEEHTSELQSLAYLVCRLLLEKKKKKKKTQSNYTRDT